MPVVMLEVDKLVDFIKNELNVEELKTSAQALKKGWDWNPFDKDGDEYVTAWEEFKHNLDLLWNFLEKIMFSVERGARVLTITEGGTKLEAAVKFIDELIKLPFWLEWLDQHVVQLLLSLLVKKTNDQYGHDWSVTGRV
ncbi:MAG: hypothetical protein AB1349_01745 [Elusimicrobiota bacterium]